jgi:hypothetical protein
MPIAVQCKLHNTQSCSARGCSKGQKTVCSVQDGSVCVNSQQAIKGGRRCMCCDYTVRFLCPADKKTHDMTTTLPTVATECKYTDIHIQITKH